MQLFFVLFCLNQINEIVEGNKKKTTATGNSKKKTWVACLREI